MQNFKKNIKIAKIVASLVARTSLGPKYTYHRIKNVQMRVFKTQFVFEVNFDHLGLFIEHLYFFGSNQLFKFLAISFYILQRVQR